MTEIPGGPGRGVLPSLTLRLAPDPDAGSLARSLVADACLAWRLPGLLHPARLVMSELVLNAVEHAGTDLVVTVTRRPAGIRVAVSDGDPRLPRLRATGPGRPGAPLDERGQGLRTVRATATRWGAKPTPTGKTVWAVLRHHSTDSGPSRSPDSGTPRAAGRGCRGCTTTPDDAGRTVATPLPSCGPTPSATSSCRAPSARRSATAPS